MDSAFLKQAWIISGVLLTMFEVGVFLGFPACLLPALLDPDSPIKADLEQSSWIAASFSLSWIPGFLSTSYCMDRFGRRMAFILNMIPGALGLVIIYFAMNIYSLIAARLLEGFAAGSTSILGAIVIGEYSSPIHRGMFLNLKTAAYYVGSTVVHLLGNYYHWRTVAGLTLIPYIVAFGMVCTWPESPSWLASEKRFDETTEVFYRLRGKTEQSTKELQRMISTQENHTNPKQQTIAKSILTFIQKCRKRDFVMPMTNYLFAAILLETTGRHIFPTYAVQIMSEVSGEHDSIYYTFALDILVTVSATFSSVLIRIFKRRTLLFSTGSAAVVILMSTCFYLFLSSRNVVPNSPWISISMLGVYFFTVNFACGPIPLLLIGEIFPLEHKAAGTFLAATMIALVSLITLKTTPILLETIKVYGTFALLGIIMAISLVILYFMLPETKDRTLQEIEDFYRHGKFIDESNGDEQEASAEMLSCESTK